MIEITNTLDLILGVARTRGCAPATKIRFRQATVDRIVREDGSRDRLDRCGIPFEVDEQMPAFPGFEIVRSAR